MNVLILTGKFGYGHMSVANSLKERFMLEYDDVNVKIVDLLEYLFPKLSKSIYGIFNFLVDKVSSVYNFLNKYASKNTSTPLKSVVVRKIDNLIADKNIDVIVSTLPICSQYISAYKKTLNVDIPLYTCITDIIVHPEWISDMCNGYLVACEQTKDYLVSEGISEDDIIVSGIPVKIDFKSDKNYNDDVMKVLIMGGGLGLIPNIDKFLDHANYDEKISVTIITGNNIKLYNKLNNKYKNVRVLFFTNEVYKLMNEADLVITKSGGVTMFEAINSYTPMIIIKPFLIQEVGNACYIEKNCIGEVMWDKSDDLYGRMLKILNDKEKLRFMRNNMVNIVNKLDDFSVFGDMVCK